MRYLVAMIFAVIGAAVAVLFIGAQAADWVVAHQAFDSSDAAENLHMMVFVGCLMGGLIVGWLAGWVIAGASGAKQTTT